MSAADLNILYLVHDLSDPAVRKRVVMLKDGGAQVSVAGFRRSAGPVSQVAACPAADLGRTYNGGFAQRIWAVMRETALIKRRENLFYDADIIIARNLEMLTLAARGRSMCANPPALVYECLDIHRLLLDRGPAGASLRALEGKLAGGAGALITSSPAFISCYFETLSKTNLPAKLIENKVYPARVAEHMPRPPGPPWRIGWFGAIRCAKSLEILAGLAGQSGGAIELVIRGRIAHDRIPTFNKTVEQTPGLTYAGPYKNPEDLAAIYGDIHFTWAVDMYEEGLNSSWLLPNRLYEGGLYGAVPLALENVETSRFLKRLGIGVTLNEPPDESLRAFFTTLTPEHYGVLENAAVAVPDSAWLCSKKDCRDLVTWLSGLAGGAVREKAA